MSSWFVSDVSMCVVGVYPRSVYVHWVCIRGQHEIGGCVSEVSMCPVYVHLRSAFVQLVFI